MVTGPAPASAALGADAADGLAGAGVGCADAELTTAGVRPGADCEAGPSVLAA